LFDFATEFAQKNKSIPPAKDFVISNELYKEFKNYVLAQDFNYKTATQEQLEETYKIAEIEGYSDRMKKEYEALLKAISASKEGDLDLFENQIKELLSNEIVSRYYFQEGRILNAFQNDLPLQEAVKIVNDKKRYNAILNP